MTPSVIILGGAGNDWEPGGGQVAPPTSELKLRPHILLSTTDPPPNDRQTSFLHKYRTMPSRKDAEAAGEHYGSVFSVSGPVIVAENLFGCAMYELV